jgi:hypothetical protein
LEFKLVVADQPGVTAAEAGEAARVAEATRASRSIAMDDGALQRCRKMEEGDNDMSDLSLGFADFLGVARYQGAWQSPTLELIDK